MKNALYTSGTQMTLLLNGKDIFLEGSKPKIEDKQVPGRHILVKKICLTIIMIRCKCLRKMCSFSTEKRVIEKPFTQKNQEKKRHAWTSCEFPSIIQPSVPFLTKKKTVKKLQVPYCYSYRFFLVALLIQITLH